jgi:sn-glycerol 3-phosphate transport system ATP-binding protein
VARFIGTPPMNVIPLAAVGSHPGLARPPSGRPPERLAVGIRPELVRIAEGGVPARVVAAEFLGADTLIETRIDGHPFIVRRPGRVAAQAGETIGLAWDPAQAHWFDLESERRIDPDEEARRSGLSSDRRMDVL